MMLETKPRKSRNQEDMEAVVSLLRKIKLYQKTLSAGDILLLDLDDTDFLTKEIEMMVNSALIVSKAVVDRLKKEMSGDE